MIVMRKGNRGQTERFQVFRRMEIGETSRLSPVFPPVFPRFFPNFFAGIQLKRRRVARPSKCRSHHSCVPCPSSTLRRAGTPTASTTGSAERTQVAPAASPLTPSTSSGQAVANNARMGHPPWANVHSSNFQCRTLSFASYICIPGYAKQVSWRLGLEDHFRLEQAAHSIRIRVHDESGDPGSGKGPIVLRNSSFGVRESGCWRTR